MSKGKLQKFTELLELPNVYENFNPNDKFLINGDDEKILIKGKWSSYHFKNDHPIVLELSLIHI